MGPTDESFNAFFDTRVKPKPVEIKPPPTQPTPPAPMVFQPRPTTLGPFPSSNQSNPFTNPQLQPRQQNIFTRPPVVTHAFQPTHQPNQFNAFNGGGQRPQYMTANQLPNPLQPTRNSQIQPTQNKKINLADFDPFA